MNTLTTNMIWDAINCPYKLHLRWNEASSEVSEYEEMKNQYASEMNLSYTNESKNELVFEKLIKFGFLQVQVTHMRIVDQNQETIDEPLIFVPYGKVSPKHRLLIAVLALISSENCLGGRIIYGDRMKYTRVKLHHFQDEAKQVCQKIEDICLGKLIPEVRLNRHCNQCPYQNRCRREAIEKDDLSLLGGIKEKDIKKWHSKGIFSLLQLSYQFKARRNRNRPDKYRRPHYFELQALSIKRNKVHIYNMPTLPETDVNLFLDVEGFNDQDFYYLIGLIVDDGKTIKQFSFWADHHRENFTIAIQLLDLIKQYDNYTLYHYGSYETKYLRFIARKLGSNYEEMVEQILQSSFNLLTVFYSNIYLPIYSNSLKEVGRYLEFDWTENNASGLQSIIWRKNWEKTGQRQLKDKLVQYNLEDCKALIVLRDFIISITKEGAEINPQGNFQHLHRTPLKLHFSKGNYALPQMKVINKIAYFDYDREKVQARTNKNIRKAIRRKKRAKVKRILKVNQRIQIEATHCIFCSGVNLKAGPQLSKKQTDLKFIRNGMKIWTILYTSNKYHCNDCLKWFLPENYPSDRLHYGHNLRSWAIHQHIVNLLSFRQIQNSLYDFFNISVSSTSLHAYKAYFGDYYLGTVKKLLEKILKSDVIYIDETPYKLHKDEVYAWVLTNGEEVVSLYRPDRKSAFLKDLLKNFRGVLVSDFFSGYDLLPCSQQKCLIHLMRDMNNDLLRNPFDEEFKRMVKEFTLLLQNTVSTIDRFGLKKRFLKKHQKEVKRFYQTILESEYSSDPAKHYQKRFRIYQGRLFQFLKHNNVSWHNGNAEHAIKLLAKHRNSSLKTMVKHRMEEYLVIMSIYQTCMYKVVGFLNFLRSKEREFDVYCDGN